MLGMKAFTLHAETINVPLSAYFHSDPVQELKSARERSIVIGASLFKDAELLTRRAAAKDEVQRLWENLRQEYVAKGRTYDKQLEEEQRGYADATIYKIQRFQGKISSGVSDFWDFMDVQGPLAYHAHWKQLGGKPNGLEGLHLYFCSSHFNNLPIVRIRCQLGADLLTGNQPILSGDVMDVELLSVAIPVAHYVLTDRRMSNRIARLGIDREWNTEIYSISDAEGLFERLEGLR
jgi:hypothetical protein